MGTILEKRPNGSVRITTTGGKKRYRNALTDVDIYSIHEDTIPEIVVESRGRTLNFIVSEIESINGAPAPAGINDVIDLLGELFKFGGGNGTGVAQEEAFAITEQPPSVYSLQGKDYVLFVNFNKLNATVQWFGSTDGTNFVFGPYTSTKYWAYKASNGPGFYRATIVYAGQTYYSNIIEITM